MGSVTENSRTMDIKADTDHDLCGSFEHNVHNFNRVFQTTKYGCVNKVHNVSFCSNKVPEHALLGFRQQ